MKLKNPTLKLFSTGLASLMLFGVSFSALAQNSLSITSPNSSSIWTPGSSQTITWTPNNSTYGNPATVFIYLNPGSGCNSGNASSTCSTAGNSQPYIIGENVPNTGSYNWQVPSFLTSPYYQDPVTVTVGASDSSAMGTSSPFTILVPGSSAPTGLNIVSPTAGQQWQLGGSQTIQWSNGTGTSSSTNVSITLVPLNSSSTPYTIASNVANTGSTNINLNSDSSGRSIPAGQYTLNIVDQNSGNILGSSGTITVNSQTTNATSTAPTLTSINPSSGPVGTVVNIIGSGFASSGNTVNFGSGTYITNVNLSSSNNSIQFTVPNQTQPCPPSNTGPCTMGTSALITPGGYGVSVTTANGTSNSLPFTVTNGSASTPALSSTSTPSSPSPTGFNEGSLIKTDNSPTVYVINNGQLLPFTSSDIFLAWGYQWTQIQTVSPSQLSQFNISPGYAPVPDGSIIKSFNNSTIYYVSNHEKRLIPSTTIAGNLGIDLSKIIPMSMQELDLYPTGQPLQ